MKMGRNEGETMKTVTLVLLAASLLFAAAPKTLSIIYTGDLHGELLPSPDWTVPGDPKPELGGLARLASLIKTERAVGPCLVLDAGDFAAGSPEVNRSRGMLMFDLMNRLGYDAICAGERDIPAIIGQPDSIARYSRFRLLGERWLTLKATIDMPVTRPSLLKDAGGVKVGLIGLLDESLVERDDGDTGLVSPGLTPDQILDREIKSLRSQNADVIIALAHMPVDRCRQLATRFPAVTAFICAHEGWVVEPGNSAQATLPMVLEAGRRGQRAGICRIHLDSTGHVVNARNRIVNLLPSRAISDSMVNTVILSAAKNLGDDDSLGASAVELLPDIGDFSPLGAWVASSIRTQTGAAVILPFSALDCALLKGTATSRSIRRTAPYDENLIRVKCSDIEIAQVLDELLSRDKTHVPIVAGIAYNIARPDSSLPQLKTRAINIKAVTPGADVILPRWLAMGAGLPARDYRPMKETFGDLLVTGVKARGIVVDSAIRNPAASSPEFGHPAAVSTRININTATREQLMALPGIGPAFGKRIVEYRQQHGPFTKIEDLMNVKGIGPKRFDRIRDKVTI
jgi:comEA protein